MQYVCGFYMNFAMDQFLLIKKNGPEWMAGKWNGVGGKINEKIMDETYGGTIIEATETPYEAMCREFKEETGIETKEYEWHCFYIKQFANNIKIYYFAAFGDKYKQAQTVTKEEVAVFEVVDLFWNPPQEFIYDVPYLIKMIQSEMRNNNFITLNPEGINNDKYRTKAEDFR